MPDTLEGDWKVDKVLAITRRAGELMAWTRWDGYNFLGDTLEPLDNIEPKSKLTIARKPKTVTVDLAVPRRRLSLNIISFLASSKISERKPVHRKEIVLDFLPFSDLAVGLIRAIGTEIGTKVKVTTKKGKKVTTLEVWELDKLADLLRIHVYKPDMGHGALRIRSGSNTYEDLTMLIPPYKIEHTEPADGALDAPRYTKQYVSTAMFNGLFGTPRFPAVVGEDEKYTQDEMDNITQQAKLTLEQVWRTEKLSHGLLAKGWHRLPFGHGLGRDRLPTGIAVLGKRKRA